MSIAAVLTRDPFATFHGVITEAQFPGLSAGAEPNTIPAWAAMLRVCLLQNIHDPVVAQTGHIAAGSALHAAVTSRYLAEYRHHVTWLQADPDRVRAFWTVERVAATQQDVYAYLFEANPWREP